MYGEYDPVPFQDLEEHVTAQDLRMKAIEGRLDELEAFRSWWFTRTMHELTQSIKRLLPGYSPHDELRGILDDMKASMAALLDQPAAEQMLKGQLDGD